MPAATSSDEVADSMILAFSILIIILSSIATVLCVTLIAATTLTLLSPKRQKEYSIYNC